MDFKRHFTKEDMQIINKQMIHSTCHNEMQIKTAMRYNCIPVRTAKIQNICTTKSGEVVEQQEFSYIPGGNAECCSHFGRQFDISY